MTVNTACVAVMPTYGRLGLLLGSRLVVAFWESGAAAAAVVTMAMTQQQQWLQWPRQQQQHSFTFVGHSSFLIEYWTSKYFRAHRQLIGVDQFWVGPNFLEKSNSLTLVVAVDTCQFAVKRGKDSVSLCGVGHNSQLERGSMVCGAGHNW